MGMYGVETELLPAVIVSPAPHAPFKIDQDSGTWHYGSVVVVAHAMWGAGDNNARTKADISDLHEAVTSASQQRQLLSSHTQVHLNILTFFICS